MNGVRRKRSIATALLAASAALAAGCTPLHLWEAHVTSAPRPPSFDVAVLAREPVATLGLVAPAGLQGLSLSVSLAFDTALSQVSPPVRGIPTYETVNRLNDNGLAADYGDMMSGFARSGILDRERLQRIGTALGTRYVLQPGLAEFTQALVDRFELSGFKLFRTRITTLRLWLQLWDTQAGLIVWASAAEITVAAELLRGERAVPLTDIAEDLWSRMIQRYLLDRGAQSRVFPSDAPPRSSVIRQRRARRARARVPTSTARSRERRGGPWPHTPTRRASPERG
jgi:hypothetical protein